MTNTDSDGAAERELAALGRHPLDLTAHVDLRLEQIIPGPPVLVGLARESEIMQRLELLHHCSVLRVVLVVGHGRRHRQHLLARRHEAVRVASVGLCRGDKLVLGTAGGPTTVAYDLFDHVGRL